MADNLVRMGELEPWIDENFVRSVWFGMGYQVNVKMIRDKFSGYVCLSGLSIQRADKTWTEVMPAIASWTSRTRTLPVALSS